MVESTTTTTSSGPVDYGSISTSSWSGSLESPSSLLSSSDDEEDARSVTLPTAEQQQQQQRWWYQAGGPKQGLEIEDRTEARRRSMGTVLIGILVGIALVYSGGFMERPRGSSYRHADDETGGGVRVRDDKRVPSSDTIRIDWSTTVPSDAATQTQTRTDEKRSTVIVQGGTASSSSSSSSSSSDELPASFGISPVDDLEMLSLHRAWDALPSAVWGNHRNIEGRALPTNSWYMNLVSQKAANGPDDQTRVYTVPYIVDTVSPGDGMEGLRIHWPYLQAFETNVQMVDDFTNMLFLGGEGVRSNGESRYRVRDGPLSNLGVGLEWLSDEDPVMATRIVRGMPYVTVEYLSSGSETTTTIPTIYSYKGLASDVQIDREEPFEPVTSGDPTLGCFGGTDANTNDATTTTSTANINDDRKVPVENHLHLHFLGSDFTWMIFFSKPVSVSCTVDDDTGSGFRLHIHDDDDDENREGAGGDDLVVRAAMLNPCTTGSSTILAYCDESYAMNDLEGYESLLKAGAHAMIGSPSIDFEHSTATAGGDETARLRIDWDASSSSSADGDTSSDDLLVFALPHHQESLSGSVTEHCVRSFHGNTCLVKGSEWVLEESLGDPLSFFAPRPPTADLVPAIAEALRDDIHYELGGNVLRGATDTYFSGKYLARVARVLVIAEELAALADASSPEDVAHLYNWSVDYNDDDAKRRQLEESMKAASEASLPSESEREASLDQLRTAVTVWLRSNAEAPYLYDESWGGLVNCGCSYVGDSDTGYCENTFPDCPVLESGNEDFGNGYYNDHHYHYGYHVYAAAVVARYDPEWGRAHFDEIMLYVRDFANPRGDDAYFPQYRQKDWYLGSSWASGLVSAENSPHGRNEESSSEAISAYEGVALFGSAMVDAFASSDDDEKDEASSSPAETAALVRDTGQLLAASEVHATNRYWHVWSSDDHENTYPEGYAHPAVGMVYDTEATLQTWFSNFHVVSYGIQLIPLTPIAEIRDDPDWAASLVPFYGDACEQAGSFCVDNGWSILQAGLEATAGDKTGALEIVGSLPPDVFESSGGNGNTMSNTLWYIATRKNIA